MSKYQGWYKTIPGKGKLPTLPPLPKAVGKRFLILAQPNLPEHWSIAQTNFVGRVATCSGIRRQFTPPFAPIYELALPLSSGDVLYWDFTGEQIDGVVIIQPDDPIEPARAFNKGYDDGLDGIYDNPYPDGTKEQRFYDGGQDVCRIYKAEVT